LSRGIFYFSLFFSSFFRFPVPVLSEGAERRRKSIGYRSLVQLDPSQHLPLLPGFFEPKSTLSPGENSPCRLFNTPQQYVESFPFGFPTKGILLFQVLGKLLQETSSISVYRIQMSFYESTIS
jgi:hypothetical protein